MRFPPNGTASGFKNGVLWAADVSAGSVADTERFYTIRFGTVDAENQLQDYFVIGHVPFESVNDTLANYYLGLDRRRDSPVHFGYYERFLSNDNTSGGWQLDLKTAHPLRLQFDAASRTVSGSFEARFYLGVDTLSSPWGVPVHFTKVNFKARVQKFNLRGE